MVVTGTRLAAAETVLPTTATVLDADEIEARADQNVPDLLRDLPGVHVVQPGAGGVTQLFIRGGEPNFTVFLLDGIRVNDPNNTRGGSFDLAAVNLADVERVEIIRGPQSSIYGSDGLAGVINLISPAGGGPLAATVEAEAGGEDFRRGTVRLTGPAGAGGFSLQLTSRDDGEPVPGGTYEADTVTGRLRLPELGPVSANLYGRYADTGGTSFPEQSGGPDHAVLRDLDESSAEDLSLGGDFDWRLGERFSVQGLASRYDREDEFTSPGIAPGDQVPPNGASNDLERDNASLRLTAGSASGITGTAGVDYQREDGRSDGYVAFAPDVRVPNSFKLDRTIIGVFAEGRLPVTDSWLLQASIRHDDPDEVSGETTGRVGMLVNSPDGRTRFRANWGTGFKLPSFFALGSPLVGEPGLRPEKSRNVDMGLARQVGRGEVSVTLFDNDYEDLIDFDPDTFKSVNRDAVETRGFELAGNFAPVEDLKLRAQATFVDIDVKDSDRELLQRPEWRGGAGLRWAPAEDVTLDLDWLYAGDSLDSSIPTGLQVLGAYHRVDLALGWQATPRWRLTLAVDNLLDASYEEAVGFPAPGIRPRLAVRYRFGG